MNQFAVFATIPDGLRIPLIESYNEIQKNFIEQRWEPSELNGGKLCEIIYTIIKGYIGGTYPPAPSKPNNMVDACRALENTPNITRSLRIQIPRMIIALYEIRNNRGVGHVSGDVNPNHMDAVAVLYMSKWLMSELVRVFHNADMVTASEIVDSLVERKSPIVWEVDGKRRILKNGLTFKDKTLVLLHSANRHLQESELIEWLEIVKPSNYRRDVLIPLHKEKLLEYNNSTKDIYISPKGIKYIEDNNILSN
ncbi:MAG: hypothetical protein HF300_15915 [Ignavibacteria bacterium]|jgi:hypothetical protein|nr:hypothetical protein [Ignavibacteria bacterium]MCU7498849.1 hypothetical protein [Ignavibacteria bacterium]MCU7514045.1 hypothetical protein [Ignavibacteria bacterium]MCU7520786.1 hypothetical protein [Ignavibacteria bacterium]MCU7523814.1 hypothetical protein [Ignavibacteria bacterium]